MVDEQAQIISLPTYEIRIQSPPPDAQINQVEHCSSKEGSFAYHRTIGRICLEIFWMSQLDVTIGRHIYQLLVNMGQDCC